MHTSPELALMFALAFIMVICYAMHMRQARREVKSAKAQLRAHKAATPVRPYSGNRTVAGASATRNTAQNTHHQAVFFDDCDRKKHDGYGFGRSSSSDDSWSSGCSDSGGGSSWD